MRAQRSWEESALSSFSSIVVKGNQRAKCSLYSFLNFGLGLATTQSTCDWSERKIDFKRSLQLELPSKSQCLLFRTPLSVRCGKQIVWNIGPLGEIFSGSQAFTFRIHLSLIEVSVHQRCGCEHITDLINSCELSSVTRHGKVSFDEKIEMRRSHFDLGYNRFSRAYFVYLCRAWRLVGVANISVRKSHGTQFKYGQAHHFIKATC